jgi:hypothetical protein
MSVFLPVPCCFYCYGSKVKFEVRYCDTSRIALFAQFALAVVLSNELLGFQVNFRIHFSICVIGILMEIALNT